MLAVAALLSATAPARAAELDIAATESVFDVEVNSLASNDMFVVLRDREGGLWLDERDYTRLRLRLPDVRSTPRDGQRYVALSSIPGLVATVDEARQRLSITAPAEAFETTRLGVASRETAALQPAGTGAFVNYQLSAQRIDDEEFGGGFGEVGFFTPRGVLTQTGVARAAGGSTRGIRLDTTFTVDRPVQMQRLTLGDAISDGGTWGSAVRFGGIGWGRNFSLRPDLLTTPLLSATGNAVVPSTVDVYVNNQRVSTESLPPGPFVIERLPAITGAGEVSVVVRDALGREQQLSQPFYSSARLLAEGLSQYEVDVGAVRRDYAFASLNYGGLLAAGTYRRGLTPALTLEAHGEYLADAAQAAGLTLAAGLGTFGVASLTAAGGGDAEDSGTLLMAGIERQSPRFNWAVASSHASAGYRQISTGGLPGLQFRRRDLAQAGANLGRHGSVAVAFVRQRYTDLEDQQATSFTYSRTVGQQSALNLTATRTTQGDEEAFGAYLTFTMAFGLNAAASMSASGGSGSGAPDDELQATYMKNAPIGLGQGYRVSASTAGNYDSQWRWQTGVGDLSLAAARYSGVSGLSADWSGAATLLGGDVRSARRVNSSFALIDVGGLPDVPVYLDNQLITRTDAKGVAILHDLRAYEPNRISVRPDELPLDTLIGARQMELAPGYRSGIVVSFPVERVRAGTFRLATEEGSPVPAGATVRMKGASFPVAYDGMTYVTGFDHGIAGDAVWNGTRCLFRLDPPPPGDPLPDMGTVVCRQVPSGRVAP